MNQFSTRCAFPYLNRMVFMAVAVELRRTKNCKRCDDLNLKCNNYLFSHLRTFCFGLQPAGPVKLLYHPPDVKLKFRSW
jgi:hypothetical protein